MHHPQAQPGEQAQIGVGQLRQGVGTEHHPPAHPAPAQTAVAAEIPEVEGALEGDEALGGHHAGLALHADVHVVAHSGIEPP